MTVTFKSLLPDCVAVCELSPAADADPLVPAEASLVSKAVPKRVHEFSLGRTCARRAIRQLGLAAGPILQDDRRCPVWPSGLTGSITHTKTLVAAAVARRSCVLSLGIDAEVNEVLSEGVLERIASDSEKEALRRLGGPEIPYERLLFSAKESVYKACYFLSLQWLSFHDVHVEFDPAAETFTAQIASGVPVIHGRYAVSEDTLLTAVAITG